MTIKVNGKGQTLAPRQPETHTDRHQI